MRILLLEDNPTDAELIEYELRESLSEFVLKWVETEENFSKEILECSPDLILSDYELPKYNGALALAEAKERCPDVPFILVTGAISEDRVIEILTRGTRDYGPFFFTSRKGQASNELDSKADIKNISSDKDGWC